MQASGLEKQLLRRRARTVHPSLILSLNDVAEGVTSGDGLSDKTSNCSLTHIWEELDRTTQAQQDSSNPGLNAQVPRPQAARSQLKLAPANQA